MKYLCDECGAMRVIDDVLYATIECLCGATMHMRLTKCVEQPKPQLQSKNPHGSSLMEYALHQNKKFYNPEKEMINLGRKENIEGLRIWVLRVAVHNYVTRVPCKLVFREAMKIDNVSEKTARDYSDHLWKSGQLDMDGECFIIDLEKAKKELKK